MFFESAQTDVGRDNFTNLIPEFDSRTLDKSISELGCDSGWSKVVGTMSSILMDFSVFLEKVFKYFWKFTLIITKHKYTYGILVNFGDP